MTWGFGIQNEKNFFFTFYPFFDGFWASNAISEPISAGSNQVKIFSSCPNINKEICVEEKKKIAIFNTPPPFSTLWGRERRGMMDETGEDWSVWYDAGFRFIDLMWFDLYTWQDY